MQACTVGGAIDYLLRHLACQVNQVCRIGGGEMIGAIHLDREVGSDLTGVFALIVKCERFKGQKIILSRATPNTVRGSICSRVTGICFNHVAIGKEGEHGLKCGSWITFRLGDRGVPGANQ